MQQQTNKLADADGEAAAKPNDRKTQISQLIKTQPESCLEILGLIDADGIEGLKSRLQTKVYKMLAKLKKNNKQINESVIDREEFI